MKNFQKNLDGITLIALVVTIIVLLILAGVSIATLTGQNGILTKAHKSKETHEIAEYEDLINLAKGNSIATNYKQPTLDELISEIYKENIVPNGYIISVDDKTAYMYTEEGYIFELKYNSLQYLSKGSTQDIEKMKSSNYMIKKQDTLEFYQTLLEAYEDANDDETIVVLKDVEETGTIASQHDENALSTLNINKNITIYIYDNKLTIDYPLFVYSNTLHIKGNGEIYCKADKSALSSYGGSIEISGNTTIKCSGVAIKMQQGDGKLTINGGYVIGEGRSGIQTWSSGDIILNNVYVLGMARCKNAITIYSGATCNITIEGNSVIENGLIDVPGTGSSETTERSSVISNHSTGKLIIAGNSIVTTHYGSAPITMYNDTKLDVLENASIYCCETTLTHGCIAVNNRSNIQLKIDTFGTLGSQSDKIISGGGDNLTNSLEVIKGNFVLTNNSSENNVFSLPNVTTPELKSSQTKDVTYLLVNPEKYTLDSLVMPNYYFVSY